MRSCYRRFGDRIARVMSKIPPMTAPRIAANRPPKSANAGTIVKPGTLPTPAPSKAPRIPSGIAITIVFMIHHSSFLSGVTSQQ